MGLRFRAYGFVAAGALDPRPPSTEWWGVGAVAELPALPPKIQTLDGFRVVYPPNRGYVVYKHF